MLLNRFKSKRKLGKGAYGEVLLVEDKNGQQFALKLIGMKNLLKQSYLLDYLEGEIQCMKNMNSPYIMKLYDTEQDENFKYLICEYCDGGDLLNLQAKQPGKVFTLQKATQILAEVIKGLFDLHEAGYLHRDIKSQNILVKTVNGKEVQFFLYKSFKLADFGFSKKCNEIGGTVLGTQNYMSPEIYKNQTYGFEVDMWAFGVLFYFMLNMEFPFKINPHAQLPVKQATLIKLATDFSYKKAVEGSKKKLMQNCTADVEDLFRKIFNPDGEERITFLKIRSHPLFSKYFPVVEQASKILYGKKFQSKILQKGKQKNGKNINKFQQDDDNVRITYSIIKPKDKKYPKQKSTLQNKKDQIDFLMQNALQFYENDQYFRPQQRYSLTFNLIKYYVILLREFTDSLNPLNLNKLYPNMAWNEFCKTNQFKDIKKQAEDNKRKYQNMFQQLYEQCSFCMIEIEKINPKFKAAYDRQIHEVAFDGVFKESYRKSTHNAFNTLRGLIKTTGRSGNKLNFNLAILVISHVFNHIFGDPQNVKKIFSQYFTQKSKSVQNLDYTELREWMTRASAGQLNSLAKQIIQLYFS